MSKLKFSLEGFKHKLRDIWVNEKIELIFHNAAWKDKKDGKY